MKTKSRAPRGVTDDSALAAQIIGDLRALRSEEGIAGMRRFGIVAGGEQLGISVTQLREIGRSYRRNHGLALALWSSGIYEARVLATVVEDPVEVTKSQMERWVRDCDNWAVTDAMAFVFDRTKEAETMIERWSRRKEEYVKRAAFSMMAGMAVHRKELPDENFVRFLPIIIRECTDDRNFVRKAVNWALRGIGKRNARLRKLAINAAEEIARIDARAARWIARDALRELRARN